MLRLGSAILASVLLGVPRALDARTFGVQRCARIEVAPSSPALDAFAAELSRALADAGFSMAARPGSRPLILHYAPEERPAAARSLLRSLEGWTVRES